MDMDIGWLLERKSVYFLPCPVAERPLPKFVSPFLLTAFLLKKKSPSNSNSWCRLQLWDLGLVLQFMRVREPGLQAPSPHAGSKLKRCPFFPLIDFSQRYDIQYWEKHLPSYLSLGKGSATKSDEFSKKFQTAFDPPPPSFSENYVANFL